MQGRLPIPTAAARDAKVKLMTYVLDITNPQPSQN